MILRRCPLFLIFFVIAGFFNLSAAEVSKDKFVRLVLDEKTGCFSLYYLLDSENMQYEPLFNDKDPSASFSEVSLNGKIYRLGESRYFQTRIEDHDGNPAVIHESSLLAITKVFYPVKTLSSAHANGIKIGITIKNKTNKDMTVGFKMLIDTYLGEGRGNIPFNTDTISVKKEILVESSSGENFWISRGTRLSLMGNITSPYRNSIKPPDFVHFANWKKLNDVPWKAPYSAGRSFSYTQYSVDDSAVCYYYEPGVLFPYDIFQYEIFLTTEDIAWYQKKGIEPPQLPRTHVEQQITQGSFFEGYAAGHPVDPEKVLLVEREIPFTVVQPPSKAVFAGIQAIIDAAVEEAAIYGEDVNMLILKRLQEVLDQFIAGEIELNEQDLLEVEMTINRYRNR